MESRPSSERLRSPPTLRQMDDRSQSGRAPGCCSLRLGLALLLHFCNVSMMSQRACLSLTMVAMVNGTGPQELPNASTPEPLDDPRVPVGYLSGIYPVKNMVGSALLLSSLLSLLVPLAAGVGASAVIACRVAQGLSQGTVLVAQHTVWTKWAPLSERGRLTSLSLSGLMLGPSLALCVTGLICQALGWPMVFYVFGAGGCALSLCWFLLFHDDPKGHPCISPGEKELIASSLVEQVGSAGKSVPIRAVLKSLPVWAISLGCFAFSWTNHVMFLYLPTFISSKLHVNVRENGLLSALPHLFCWLLGILAGHVSDGFLSRKMLSVLAVRKLFTALGLLLPAVFVVSLLYLGPSFQGTVTCLTLASATLGFCVAGIVINPLDIAPRYYGFLKGVTVLIGMTGGLISSTLAGIVLDQVRRGSCQPGGGRSVFIIHHQTLGEARGPGEGGGEGGCHRARPSGPDAQRHRKRS
ncbi:sodium-dependent phosphate transport protein 1 isoform X3 [Pipistrellus kuhlii]|uniref:sodium-dependent phosphate transport protein 1 isoform X3 n=1 Tax=Pipistrellus kuhlii TaxID=59472 RepID=UPI001E271AC5|nr:sodium-dependent phosphate transport protein 1 isoform X3 [Pipistrellus kuhlii]